MVSGKNFLFGFLFFLSAFGANGQNRDSLLRLYNSQTITRFGNNFQKGGDRLYFRDLGNEFSFSPMGIVAYELAKKQRTTAMVLRVLSVAGSIATLTLLSRQNRTATYIAWGGQAALNLAGFYYQDRSNKLLDAALWQRNKDLLFGP